MHFPGSSAVHLLFVFYLFKSSKNKFCCMYSFRYSEMDPSMTGRGAELVYRINGTIFFPLKIS